MSFSKQRVFSHSENINYNDYLKNKNGIAMLKELKHRQTNMNDISLHSFVNYDAFFTLSQTYYHSLGSNNTNKRYATQNMYESNTSYKILEDNCDCDDESIIEDNKNCKNNILYPYGEYCGKNVCNEYFPSNLDLNKWCSNKSTKHESTCIDLEESDQDIMKLILQQEQEQEEFAPISAATNVMFNMNPNPTSNLKFIMNLKPMIRMKPSKVVQMPQKKCKTGLCKKGKAIFV